MLRWRGGLLGAVNLVSFLLSIPLLAGAIWLAARADTSDCLRFLQWPLLFVALTLMAVSLAGLAGAWLKIFLLLRLYLLVLFLLLVALLFFVAFAFAVTDRGSGQVVMNRAFLEYQLADYNGWLRDFVSDRSRWSAIRACLRDAGACRRMRRLVRDPATGLRSPESADMFYRRDLSPIQSGCCKPPTSCGFTYVNETMWQAVAAAPTGDVGVVTDADCARWSNDQRALCYGCDSCKAGVLAAVRRSWRKVSVLNIVALVLLSAVLVVGCAAFRNARPVENSEPFGAAGMKKAEPSWSSF